MKKIVYLLLLLFCCSNFVFSQSTTKLPTLPYESDDPRCQTMDAIDYRVANDADYAQFYNASRAIPPAADQSRIPCDGTNSIVVPVAFHYAPGVVTCGDIDCLLEEAQDQLDVLNTAFGSNVAQSATMVAACPAAYGNGADVSTGTCISFCLAIPPAGGAAGLDPACDPPITVGVFTGGFGAGGGGAPGWNNILNMFITNGSCLGVADGIPGAGNGDGVSTCDIAFGGPDPSAGCGLDTDGTYNLGATMIHEVGHYLGLYHTFQGGCGDEPNGPGPFNVDDTPPASAPYFGCNMATCEASGCGGDQGIANYMDYTGDACMTLFTEDQAQVMNYWANQLFGSVASQCSTPADPTAVTLNSLCEMQPCVLVCPTAVVTALDETNTYCGVSTPTAFPDPTALGVSLDDNSDVVYSWSTGGYLSAGGTAVAAPAILTSANCSVETETYYLNADCGTTPLAAPLDAGTWVLTVYPAPPADISTLVTVTDGACDGPMVEAVAGCEAYVDIVADAGNPAFPVNAGDMGTASYTVTFTSDPAGPDCCVTGNPDDEGEILVNGDFNGGVAPWVELEEVPAGTPNPAPFGIIGVSAGNIDGTADAWFGGWGGDSYLTLTQDITIPDCNVVELSFDYVFTACGAPSDYLEVQIGGVSIITIPCDDTNPSFGPVDVLALGVAPGATQIVIIGEENSGVNTNIFVDNVSLVASDCTVPAVCDVVVTGNYNCEATGVGYCDNICFAEYVANPGPDDFVDVTLCVTALGCADSPDASCLMTAPCDDGDPCTENETETTIIETGEVCTSCGGGTAVTTCTLPSVAQACDDGDPCTENDMEEVDACDAAVVCVPCTGTPATPACGDPDATNYDATATCIDNTLCTYGSYCDNICYAEYAPNPGPNDMPDATLCVTPLGCADSPDASCVSTQACDDGDPCTENEEATVILADGTVCPDCGLNATPVTPACGDPTADNYDATATCIDNSLCTYTCEDDISGTITLTGCDFTGTLVTIYDASGAVVGMASADAMGNYSLVGPFECGSYTAEVTAAPPCYINEGGDLGPGQFIIDGDGTPDGFAFAPIPNNIPTVGEWGLIILGLLMSITAVVGIRARREEEIYS